MPSHRVCIICCMNNRTIISFSVQINYIQKVAFFFFGKGGGVRINMCKLLEILPYVAIFDSRV